MKIKELYQRAIVEGIKADIRGDSGIKKLLAETDARFQALSGRDKELFDRETLSNPFADSRIIHGDPETEIKSLIAGIDVEGAEMLTAHTLRSRGERIDMVMAHHPEGKAYANFYEVMDLQVDAYFNEGISISAAQDFLSERKSQVARRVHAANHQRTADVARLIDLPLMCLHTPCDNLAFQFVNDLVSDKKPETLGKIIELLMNVPEYDHAARINNPPMIVSGAKDSRVSRVHLEFTGGTQGPQDIYSHLAQKGVDTIIAMHQSEDHYKKCKEFHINVIFASHIASDSLGVNLMLDHLEKSAGTLEIKEFGGFHRVKR
jgi:putative NIF3 family GTP cyclohydrolase 1 type 2